MDILQVQIKRAGYADNKKAIENINFSLKKGELAGLIGPNGAGKSTTIKAILAHALDTAERICNSFVLLADGKLVAQGNLEQIREICRMPGASLFDCFNTILENLE